MSYLFYGDALGSLEMCNGYCSHEDTGDGMKMVVSDDCCLGYVVLMLSPAGFEAVC